MAAKRTDAIKFFNYGKSFIVTKNHSVNTPRFLIEAKCTIIDGEKKEDYYLCAPCKGENTFAKKDLFSEKSFEFIPVIGKKEIVIFRKFGFFNDGEKNEYKKTYNSKDVWGDKKIVANEVSGKKLLDTPLKISLAVKSGLPIMCRLVYRPEKIRYAVIDFPVKTINIYKNKWQVDTGLIPFPNLEKDFTYQSFSFDLAYIAFNSFKFAEILIRDFFQLTKSYWIIYPQKILKINNPKIYLYSL